jgi:hypothetical protein
MYVDCGKDTQKKQLPIYKGYKFGLCNLAGPYFEEIYLPAG